MAEEKVYVIPNKSVGDVPIIQTDPPKVEFPIEDKEIVLIQCFACKKNYMEDLVKKVKIKEEFEESYQLVTRYVCPSCYKKLLQFRFVQESNTEKNEKEVRKNEEEI